MEESVERAAIRAISAMHENLGEPLSVDDMARAAMFSKFHFTRIFQRATGVSPGRFLSALRLQRAKQLLISTSLNVSDISVRVGFNSVGTFSSRFSRSVGMSPTAYRRMAGYAVHIPTDLGGNRGQPSNARICGRLRFAEGAHPGLVFLGLFQQRIPEGRPVRCGILNHQTSFHFDSVPHGTWYLLAQCVAHSPLTPVEHVARANQAVSVATFGPLDVAQGAAITADLTFKPASTLDPPVLMALLDARKLALLRAGSSRWVDAGAFDALARHAVDMARPAA